jgi:hypothetical protein
MFMNISEAKNVLIVDFLKMKGHYPVNTRYGRALYISPLRNEKVPSFNVFLDKNRWWDFGSGQGGDLINLVMIMCHGNVGEALEIIGLNSYLPVPRKTPAPVFQDRKYPDDTGRIRITKFKDLQHPALIQYLAKRKVSLLFARTFLKEAYYSVHGSKYFALAFRNDKGGYELRSESYKTGSSPKFITTIPGEYKSSINVFEGFMDFLSCCTYYDRVPANRTIILNSLSFLPRIEDVLARSRQVHLFLDNDEAGRNAAKKILDKYNSAKDWAPIIYPDYKDFNDFHMGKKL